MAEEFVTEEELLGGDPSLTSDSTQEDTQTFTFYAGDENIRGVEGGSYLANQEGYMLATVDDLREYYENAEVLQETFGTFDNYLSYMTERENLIQSGQYDPGSYGDIVDTGMVQNIDGTMIDPDDIQNLSPNDFLAKYGIDKSELQIVEVETTQARNQGYTDWLNSEAVQELNAKYGISNVLQTDDGREYMWNGTAWVKTKDKETFDFGDALKLVAGVGMTTLVGGALAGQLAGAFVNAGMSQAAASAASNAIINAASQLAMTGDVDITQAVLSAAGGYLNSTGLENVLGDSEVGQALADIGEQVQNTIDTFQEAISTGNSIADAAIQAGGMSMLISFVEDGQIDAEQAIIAAGIAGGTEFLNQLVDSGTVTQEQVDEYEEMGPPEELAGTDLDGDGITDTEVADGLFMLSDGTVVNADNETIGTMDELDLDGNGVLDASDLQEVSVDVEPIDFDQGYADTDRFFTPNGRYYVDDNGTIYSARDVTFGDYNGETTMFVNGQPVGWMEEVTYTTDGRFVTAKPWEARGLTEEEWNLLSQDQRDTVISQLEDVEYDSVFDTETGEIQFIDQGMEQIVDGSVDQVMGEDLIGAPSDVMPGDYVNSEGQNIQYMGTQYGYVDSNGNWIPGTVGQETDIYWNSETQEYETKNGTIINFTEEPPEVPVESEPVEAEDQTEPESDILDSTEETLEGATGDPATGAEPGGASAQELEQQYEDAVNAGDLFLAEQIAEQMENLETQPADATQPDSVTKPDVIDIFESEGQTSTPIGPAPSGSVIVDDRTQWQKNKDYIISQVSAGEATAGQLEWYERWQAAGSPETQEGMGSGTGAQEGISTGEGGGLTGETGAGAPSPQSPVRPAITGLAGLTAGLGLSAQLPGKLDSGIGDPGIGEGIGGVGEGGTGEGGMLTQKSPFRMPDFNPLYTTIEYTTPTIQPIIVDNRQDYVRELDGLINRGLFTSQKGIA